MVGQLRRVRFVCLTKLYATFYESELRYKFLSIDIDDLGAFHLKHIQGNVYIGVEATEQDMHKPYRFRCQAKLFDNSTCGREFHTYRELVQHCVHSPDDAHMYCNVLNRLAVANQGVFLFSCAL